MSSSTELRKAHNIVIVGGGIIGCSTAYYLSRHPAFSSSTSSIKVIEASKFGPAQGASGKAGGLVAKWAYPRELVDISSGEHVKLAEEHNGKDRWGWRFVNCGSWEGKGVLSEDSGSGVGKGGQRKSLEKTLGLDDSSHGKPSDLTSRRRKGLPDDLNWVDEDLTYSYSSMAPTGHTAQVHPYLFTTSMMELAKEKGAELISGRVTEVLETDGKVTGVRLVKPDSDEEPETMPATDVIITAGAWSPSILPALPISATRAHSITIHPQPSSQVTIAPYVLFTEISFSASGGARTTRVSPEIYARPDNEVYACGPGDDSDLPSTVDQVVVDENACESIRKHVSSISPQLRDGVVDKRQACFLPIVSSGGGPIVGAVSGSRGLFVATGHTCWGICNAPGTGKVLSELVFDGKIRAGNLKKLDPSRFL
ncbi:FAD dependent oxidoreductase [Dendrothele bispora CBS 962.96]|uniref:FAD dependent oxidoreductase n=1 Tax=Dendrothele bispora (strain CBS 962.96) TaxID=1314807 RepID=A0A4S8MRI9_DENBC|nr:FAD dependent oxidoreductase [Dendrothele bispora CBS 962.96]